MKTVIIIWASLLFFSCNKLENKDGVYFGGEILNPKSQYVLLMKNEKVLDSILLKSDNTFEKYYDSLSPGLYFFKHGSEFQYIFLEPKDSIKIRLNTWDFDESLVFDGVGSEKNDFLLNVFLKSEKEMNNFYSYFPLPEEEFSKKYQETFERNRSILDQFFKSNPGLSKDFKYLAENAVVLPIFRFKELYPYYHQKMNGVDSIIPISPDFYDFRNEINLNDPRLAEYFAYQNYISSYLYNDANFKNDFKGIDDNFRTILLNSITEKIKNEDLKNRLLYQEIFNCIFKTEKGVMEENLNLFYENCTDSELVNKIKTILALKKDLPENKRMFDFELLNEDNKSVMLSQLTENKISIIYFWSKEISTVDFVNKRIHFLSTKYPDVTFIGIHHNSSDMVNDARFSSEQYYLSENSEGNKLISHDFPRTIMIDKSGKVVKNFTFLSDISLEMQLEKLLNN